MPAQHRRYGNGSGYQKEPTAFKKPPPKGSGLRTGGRSEDAVRDDHIAQEYTNTHIWRGPCGSWMQYCFAKDKEMFEIQHASGSGMKILNDGSMDQEVTGNHRSYTKGSSTSTIHGNSDSKIEGTSRTNIQGGSETEIAGDSTMMVGGAMSTLATQGMQIHSRGSSTFSGEKGVAFGVGKDTTQHSQMRMFEDGSMRIQVQPSGSSGGVATIDIGADGEVKITTAESLSINAGKAINFEAPQFNIKAEMDLTGNFTQKGIHKDSNGPHTA